MNDRGEESFGGTSRQRAVIPDAARPSGSRRAQRLHAGVMLVLPTAAVVLAAAEVWRGAAPSWGPWLAVVFYAVTMFGITAGFHRLSAHRAYVASRGVKRVLLVLGCMSVQGPPVYWVSNHRRHHKFVEREGDPHSPNGAGAKWRGFFHAHIGWTFSHELTNAVTFAPDLLRDKDVMWVNRRYYVWVTLGLFIAAAIGVVLDHSMHGAWEGLLWGGGVRLFLSYHLTSSINSITHVAGYRNFSLHDCSRNNFWLGLPTLGEAWHNNHHAYPAAADFSCRWWEIDLAGLLLRGLQRAGLVSGVTKPLRPARDVTAASEAAVRSKRIIQDSRLQRRQHLLSALTMLLGFAGLLYALGVALFGPGITAFDLLLFAAFFLPIMLGVTVGFHRHLTHRSFGAHPRVRWMLAVLGSMAGQGPPVFWVALHRMHHEFADCEGDPHSPNLSGTGWWGRMRGLLHAYIAWPLRHEVPNAMYYARDLLTDPLVLRVNRRYYFWVAAGLVLPALAGGLLAGSAAGAVSGFMWGGLVRMFAGHHMIWWITSFAHVFGTRDFVSADRSTNNVWLALPTLGESWHNNHHSFPHAAVLSFRWWQIDASGLVILALERLGLAYNVRRPSAASLREREAR